MMTPAVVDNACGAGTLSEPWGRFEAVSGHTVMWRLGPFQLWATRSPLEWTLSLQRFANPEDDSFEWDSAAEIPPDDDLTDTIRVISDSTSQHLSMQPKLADRTVVVRPETSLKILPRAAVHLYISSPLWIQVQVGEPLQDVLDTPSWRLNDTWFGPNTGHGEICYAIKANARLRLDNLPHVRHRATTQLFLTNRTAQAMDLQRLALPIPNLALYKDAACRVWTQSIRVDLTDGGHNADLEIDRGVPSGLVDPELLASPRIPPTRNIFRRARHALLT